MSNSCWRFNPSERPVMEDLLQQCGGFLNRVSFRDPKDKKRYCQYVLPRYPLENRHTVLASRSSNLDEWKNVHPTLLKVQSALAFSVGSPAIFYDITRSPAHDNILAPPPTSLLASLTRRLRAPPQLVPTHTLTLPATRPFVPRLILALPGPHSGLPVPVPAEWVIFAESMSSSDPQHAALTNLDVLHAVYKSLRAPVSRREWESPDTDSSSQRRIAEAYKHRREASGRQKEWDARVRRLRRIDWLCGRTMLHGLEIKLDGQCEFVFAKPD